jgi:hypothetical protein
LLGGGSAKITSCGGRGAPHPSFLLSVLRDLSECIQKHLLSVLELAVNLAGHIISGESSPPLIDTSLTFIPSLVP